MNISWWSNSLFGDFFHVQILNIQIFQRMTNYCIYKYSLLSCFLWFSFPLFFLFLQIGDPLTWLTSDRPFLRHMSAHTWAASTTQRRGCSASSVKFSCNWNIQIHTCNPQCWTFTRYSFILLINDILTVSTKSGRYWIAPVWHNSTYKPEIRYRLGLNNRYRVLQWPPPTAVVHVCYSLEENNLWNYCISEAN